MRERNLVEKYDAAAPDRNRKWHWETNWNELGFEADVDGLHQAQYDIAPRDVGASESSTTVAKVFFPPGFVVETHMHATSYGEIILEGSLTVGRKQYGPGDIRVVGPDTAYGPTVYGPAGGLVLLIFSAGNHGATFLTPRTRASTTSNAE